MLREPGILRRFNERIELVKLEASVDDYGMPQVGDPSHVLTVFASVRKISDYKTLLTYQQANVCGLEIMFVTPALRDYNAIMWRGLHVTIASSEDIDNRGMITRVTGYYQTDTPAR